MSSPHGHPQGQQYQQLHGHQPFAQQYPQVTPSPPTHTPIPHATPPFAPPGLSTSPTLTFQHSLAPSHSHPPKPTISSSPHHAPAPNNTSDLNPTPPYPNQEPYHDHAAAPMLRQQSQPAHPSFLPIFTLIEDSTSQEHFHPKVHYIFEDDVDTPLGIALGSRAAPQLEEAKQQQPPEDQGQRGSRRRRGKPPPKDATGGGVGDVDAMGWPRDIRPIIVQMSQDLTHVERAYSLAPEWQLTNVQVGKAPKWLVGEEFSAGGVGSVLSVTGQGPGGGPSGGGGAGGNGWMGLQGQADQPQEGLMLTIEGTSIPDPSKKGTAAGAGAGESLYDLANSFADRMAMIKRVIEFGQQQEYEEQMRQRERERQQRGEQEQWNQAQQYQDGVGGLGVGYDYGVPQGQDRFDQTQGYQGHYDRDDRREQQVRDRSHNIGQAEGQGQGQSQSQSYNGRGAEREAVHPTYLLEGKVQEEDVEWKAVLP